MKKTVTEVITALKKYPEPGKRTGSFWDFMKNQLAEEGEWDQKHLKIIEMEIDKYLGNVDKKSLSEMWQETKTAAEAGNKKISVKEIKDNIADELIGQVMDRMDDNYTARESNYTSSESFSPLKKEDGKKEVGDETDFDEDVEPDEIIDDDFNQDDNDMFNDDDEEDDYKF